MQIRAINDDEIPAFRKALHLTFGGDETLDAGGDERMRALLEPGRAFAAFDGAEVVATAGTFTHTLTIPGGTIAMAGLTMVTVRPTHRRRGILRGLIDLHLADAERRGEPISGLWASEASIYGRFGYGVAAESEELSFQAEGIGEIAVPGGAADAIDLVDEQVAAATYPELYARALAARPGTYVRTPAWWKYRRFLDRPDLRKGASPRRFLLARRDGAPTGWMVYRQRMGWTDGLPSGTTEIEELIGIDPRAEASLWRFACRVDLFPRVSWENAPVDTLLPYLIADARRVKRRRGDTLWLRPGDVARTLAGRRYAVDAALRLGVDGTTYLLEGGRCAPTDAAPEVTLGRAELGSVFLGGTPPTLLARAGRIAGAPEAIARMERVFAWPVPPWCQEMF